MESKLKIFVHIEDTIGLMGFYSVDIGSRLESVWNVRNP